MSRALPALYLAILAIFVTAGSLLTARSDPAATTQALPDECSSVPSEAVTGLFPSDTPTEQAQVDEDARYGRWLDADGTLLVELRCTRFRLADLGDFRDALEAAEEGQGTVLDVDPPAILAEVPDGAIVRQLDEPSGILRTWFVRSTLTPDEAVDLVRRTRAAQRDAPADRDA